MSIIVGILALLVTVLIGWNIYSVLDFKKEILSKIEEKHTDSLNQLTNHSQMNDKDFTNIIKALHRCEKYCDKLDESILTIAKDFYGGKTNCEVFESRINDIEKRLKGNSSNQIKKD